MRAVLFFGFWLIGSYLSLPSASGYVADHLYGRAFNLFTLFPLPRKVTQSDVTSILTRLSTLEAVVPLLQSQLALLQPSCPSTAPASAKIVLGKCYQVFSNPLATFTDAQAACNSNGGILAEPLPANSALWYNAIKAAFPTEASAINTGGIWLGLRQTGVLPTSPFAYISNPALQVSPAQFTPFVIPASLTNVAVLATPAGTQWTWVDSAVAGTTRAYVCQY